MDVDSRLSGQASILLYRDDPEITGFGQKEGEAVQAVLALSDYNRQLALLGQPAIALAPGAYQLVEESPINGASHWRWLIVEDTVAEKLEIQNQCWSANYAENAEETERTIFQLIAPMDTTRSVYADSRLETYMDMMGSKILVLFLGLYLGFTFLLAAAAVLALQQLSQGADNTRRYAVLRRLGAEEKQVARSATQQVALAFLLPLVLALVHSVVGMKAANEIIATAGRVDSAASSAVTAGVLLIVYGGYFLATSLACRRMAKNA